MILKRAGRFETLRLPEDEKLPANTVAVLNWKFAEFIDVLTQGMAPTAEMPETARVDPHHVNARLALDDPLRELPTGAARRGDAETVPLVEPEIPDARRVTCG